MISKSAILRLLFILEMDICYAYSSAYFTYFQPILLLATLCYCALQNFAGVLGHRQQVQFRQTVPPPSDVNLAEPNPQAPSSRLVEYLSPAQRLQGRSHPLHWNCQASAPLYTRISSE